jgi:hypothetical protein
VLFGTIAGHNYELAGIVIRLKWQTCLSATSRLVLTQRGLANYTAASEYSLS